jgi:hypothetical protein
MGQKVLMLSRTVGECKPLVDGHEATPLLNAAQNGHADVVARLIRARAGAYIRSHFSST